MSLRVLGFESTVQKARLFFGRAGGGGGGGQMAQNLDASAVGLAKKKKPE